MCCCLIFNTSKCCFSIVCAFDGLINLSVLTFISVVLSTKHTTDAFTGVTILVALCFLAFLFAITGCWGAFVQSSFCLWLYTIILFIILAGKIALYILIFEKLNARHEASVAIEHSWKLQKQGVNKMDQYQRTLNCCGVDGPFDYIQNKLPFPESCRNQTNSDNLQNIHKIGCRDALSNLLEPVIFWYLIFFWICFAVDILTFKCALILAIRSICKKSE